MEEKEEEIIDFQSSKLGTKEHWDEVYEREVNNFEENGDIGEVWFGEDIAEGVVEFVEKFEGINKDTSSILDLGCGNGYSLIQFAKAGFKKLHGCDYSLTAIELAKKITETEELNEEIQYFVADVLNFQAKDQYQLIIDKGTFDAIALSNNRSEAKEKYIQTLKKILLPSPFSYFVITSCNFTKAELLVIFQDLSYHSEIKYRTIQFGGVQGSTVTTLSFKRKS